jgi:hypothetical protein
MTDSVYARAGINLVGREDQRREGREVAIANVQAGQGTKSAQSKAVAKPSGSISVASNSNDYGLAAGASSIGSFSISYSVPGLGEGIEIPLTFNFRVTGQLKAIEATTISSFAYQVEASGTNGTEIINGEATIGTGRGFEQKIESSSGFVSGAVQSPESSFSFSVPIEVEVGNTGSIQGSLLGNATAGGDSTIGNSTFDLSLDSITVPQSFTAIDVTGLKLEFSSGITKSIETNYGNQERFSEQQLQAMDQFIDGLEICGIFFAGAAGIAAKIPGGTGIASLLTLGSALFFGFAWYVEEVTEAKPDPDYSVLFTPQSMDFNQETLDDLSTTESFEDATDDLITALSMNLVLAEALDVTLDRAYGAEIADDLVWVEQQELLAGEYTHQLSVGIDVLTDTLLDFADQYRLSGSPQVTFSPDEIIEFQGSLINEGIPEMIDSNLRELGFEQNEINEISNGMINANPFLFGVDTFELAELIPSQELLMKFENASSALSQGLIG